MQAVTLKSSFSLYIFTRLSSHSAPHFCRYCRECEVGIHVIATNLGISCYSHDRYLCSRCSGYVGGPFFIGIFQRISFSPSCLARVRRARDPHCFVILHSCKYFTLLCHYVLEAYASWNDSERRKGLLLTFCNFQLRLEYLQV